MDNKMICLITGYISVSEEGSDANHSRYFLNRYVFSADLNDAVE